MIAARPVPPSDPAGPTVALEFPGADIARLRFGAPDPANSYLPATASAGRAPADATPFVRPVPGGGFSFADGGGTFILRLTASEAAAGLRLEFEVAGELHYYGLGQGGAPFDRTGTSRRLWNAHVNHGLGGDISIPLLVTDAGLALFFDNPAMATLDAGRSYDDICFDYTTAAREFDLYAIRAPDTRALLGRIADLLGHAPMPPGWSLGYLQSTRHFASADEIRALAGEFRRRKLPCDGIAFLSTYGEAKGWNAGVGHLAPEPDLFADPAALIGALHAEHLHVVLHEYPVVHAGSALHAEAEAGGHLLAATYPDRRDGTRPDNYHEGQRFLDVSRPETGAWWWDRHRALVEAGVDGWWLDGGEGPMGDDSDAPRHNRYDLMRQEAFAAGEARDRPDVRPFLLARSGGPGMQRHGTACWSGDIDASFAALEAQIAVGLNVGLSGVPFWGTDIGGYYPNAGATAELFARWFAFGAFCPLFRGHGRQWRNHTPWAHGPRVEAICRAILELRMRLMPYTYTLAAAAHRTGLPLMRPLMLNYPDDPQCRALGTQYLWGDDLLVAPVTRPGATHWPVYLPAGGWTDYWTGERFEGGRGITVAAPLERIPLFVRAGAILPLGPVRAFWSGPPEHLTLRVDPAGASAFELYEDDGISRDYERGVFAVTRIEATADGDRIIARIGAPQGEPGIVPNNRRYELSLPATRRPSSIVRSGDAPVTARLEHDGRLVLGPLAAPTEVTAIW